MSFFEDEDGMPILDFKEKYANELKDKHGIYVVQSNLEQDLDDNGRITRRRNYSGTVVKVGRSQGSFISRFDAYAREVGVKKMSRTDQGGIRILYVRFLPKKDPLMTGKSWTELFETQLHRQLKEKYGNIPGRGKERYRVPSVGELFNIINNFTADKSEDTEEFVRRSERLGGESLMWLTKDSSNPDDLKLHFHKDFDEIMKRYKNQITKRFKGLTEGMLPPTEIIRYLTNIQYVNNPSRTDMRNYAISDGVYDAPSVNPANVHLYDQISNPWANDEGVGDNQEEMSIEYSGGLNVNASPFNPINRGGLNTGALPFSPFITAAQGASRRNIIL